MKKIFDAYKSYWKWLKKEDFILYLIINIFNYLLIFFIILYFILSNMAIVARFKDMSKELACYDRIESSLKEKYPSFRKLEIKLLENGPRRLTTSLEFVYRDDNYLSKAETNDIATLLFDYISSEFNGSKYSIHFDIFIKDNCGSYIDIYNGFFKRQYYSYIYDVERNSWEERESLETSFNYRELE